MNIDRIRVGIIDTICYLITLDDGSAFLIDPGAEPEKIQAAIDRRGARVKFILLTHGHYDHIEAIPKLQEVNPCPVYIHELDAELLNGKIWTNYLGRPFPEVKADHFVEDGQQIPFGDTTINVTHTPGHSPGGVCYQYGDQLFTGDTLFAGGGVGRTDLWRSSYPSLQHSIKEKLFKLSDSLVVYPGHGNHSTLGAERSIHQRFKKFI